MSFGTSTFSGIHCPLVTPFTDDGSIDTQSYRSVIDFVLDGGIDGLVPCGTTGEFASLNEDEYRRILDTTVTHVNGRGPILAGAAAPSVSVTLDRVEIANRMGVDAALITLPYFHTSNADTGDLEFLRRIADEAALPVYLYNIPQCTGKSIPLDVIAEISGHENVYGMKDSSGDFNYFLEAIRRTPEEFQLLQGFDSLLVSALEAGADGGINALSGLYPEAFSDAYSAVQSGDLERATQIQKTDISPVFQQCLESGFAPVTKAGLAERGTIESGHVRPPLVEVDGESL